MESEQNIVELVYGAKRGGAAADKLIDLYLPFIKSETAKFLNRFPEEGRDDELSIAMFAFHEAAMSYERLRGAFLPYAARAIRNRLIDYSRRERRHRGQLSLDDGGDDISPLGERIEAGSDELMELAERSAAQNEITDFAGTLAHYGISLDDVAGNCPKQSRTLAACHRALDYAKEDPELLRQLTETKKLPLARLAEVPGVERKTLERHRKYMMAILLAYTNGFEIIRHHLGQMVPAERRLPE